MLPKFSETYFKHIFTNYKLTRREYMYMTKHTHNTLSTLVLSDYSNLTYLDLRHILNEGDYIKLEQPKLIIYPTLNFWSLFNKNYFISLWSSDSHQGTRHTSYSNIIYTVSYHV